MLPPRGGDSFYLSDVSSFVPEGVQHPAARGRSAGIQ